MSYGRLVMALLAAVCLLPWEQDERTGRVAAQVRAVYGLGCGGTRAGSAVCSFSAGALTGSAGDSAVLTISVTGPADISLASAYAADPTGRLCSESDGGGTQTVTLLCPNGLQSTGTVWLTFAPLDHPAFIEATAAYTRDAAVKPITGPSMVKLGFSYPPGARTRLPYQGGVQAARGSGWNLVGGPTGWNPIGGPNFGIWHVGAIYTFGGDDSDYDVVPEGVPLLGGAGYWVNYDAPTVTDIWAPDAPKSLSLLLPASRWVLVGNPGYDVAAVAGADAVYTYDPEGGSYSYATRLAPGQGAWAWSAGGGVLTISSTTR